MKSYAHLKPRQKGTRRLVAEYGKALPCVRYRNHEKRRVRLKTVEIIFKEKAHTPSLRYRDADIVSVMVPFTAKALRQELKAAGGRWDTEERPWRVRYGLTRGTRSMWKGLCRDEEGSLEIPGIRNIATYLYWA
jgi:hypothetical protein